MDYIKDPVFIIRQKYFDNKIENEKMVNTKITEELKAHNDSVTTKIKGKSRNYLGDEEATKNSESSSDKIEE